MSPALIAGVIFLVALFLLLSERIDRTIVAMAGASLMIAVGLAMGFYDEHLATQALDFETLGLLFGMMVLVALLRPTGVFEYFATRAARMSGGSPVKLLLLLGVITTVLSMFLDNVTTVVLMGPITVLISEILGLSPVPFLISQALLSNTGGVATLIGDPPNVIIGSAVGLTFNDFLTHALPVVVVAWIAALGLLIWLFRRELAVHPEDPTVVERLRPSEALRDVPAARKVGVVLALTIVLFFLQGLLNLSSSFIALSMASLALLWLRPTVEEVLHLVEWPVLLFFGGLFVMVGGLEASGALQGVEQLMLSLGRGRPAISAVSMVWLSGVGSSLVDNIPITVALIPVIEELAADGMNVSALWWALAFGAGFGGNGTIIGATTNVVIVQLSKQTREPISSALWMRRGLPVMLVTCAIGSLALWLFLPFFQR